MFKNNINQYYLHENTLYWEFQLVYTPTIPKKYPCDVRIFLVMSQIPTHKQSHGIQESLCASRSTWIKAKTCLKSVF